MLNFTYNNDYLSRCDELNRCSTKSVFSKQKVERVVLHSKVNSLLSLYDEGSLSENNQIKSCLFFYLFVGQEGLVSIRNKKLTSSRRGVKQLDYSLKVTFISTKKIGNFLRDLFSSKSTISRIKYTNGSKIELKIDSSLSFSFTSVLDEIFEVENFEKSALFLDLFLTAESIRLKQVLIYPFWR